MPQLTAKNHYIPQAYQRAWSDSGTHVQVYRLLVPSEREPLWRLEAIRRIGMEEHLYTSVLGGINDDSFETWMREEVEDPAFEAIDKVRRGRRMNVQDYHRLAYYFAAMDLRTPAGYLAHIAFVNRSLPEVIDEVLTRLPERLSATSAAGEGVAEVEPTVLLSEAPPTRVTVTPQESEDMALLRVEVTNGREYWLRTIRRLLRTTARVLTEHRWAILEPGDGTEWPSSDRPALRLNFYGDGHYTYDGGWGSRGTDLILPLSPQHLLHTRIGYRDSRHGRALPEVTRRIRRAVVDGALRLVISRVPSDDIPLMRQRRVDRALWMLEREQWESFHQSQASVEHDVVAATDGQSPDSGAGMAPT
jgi:hypothetical protein